MSEQTLDPSDELLLMEINKYVGDSQLRLLSQEMVQKREELPATPDDTGDTPEQKDSFSTNVDEWQDFDDDEIIHTILSATEIEEKTALWMVNNADYLKEQELKKALKDTQAMYVGQRKKRAKANTSRIEPSTTAAEAARKLLTQKRLSKKINYAVLDNLFDAPANGQTNGVKGKSTVGSPSMLSPLPGGSRAQSPVREIVEEEGEPPQTTENNDEIAEEEDEEDDEDFDEEFVNQSALYGDEYDDYNEDVD
ncbi:transcription factor TFIIIB subunit brf1 [Dispira parvispora]|uniref:Transcription factor TFIIIB subunit brf1 n=1 Tax=Dispira parvispora TaxID=1520584 RepID=A0A9W8AN21_9FUNG|nr:transcription factor TFIIIB subunit brf1 [Dispira parvispora]